MENQAIVKNSARDELLDKISKLNLIVAEEEKIDALLKKRRQIKESIPEYDLALKGLVSKWLAVKGKVFDNLKEDEKSILDQIIFKKAKLWYKLMQSITGLLGALYLTVMYYLVLLLMQEKNDVNLFYAIICVLITVFGWMAPASVYMAVQNSKIYKFLKNRKICFPEENKNEHTGIFGL